MPSTCWVDGCYQTRNLFSFPTNQKLRKKWLEAIQKKKFAPTRHTKICVQHFDQQDIIGTFKINSATGAVLIKKNSIISLKDGAVPVKRLTRNMKVPESDVSNQEGGKRKEQLSKEEIPVNNADSNRQSVKRKFNDQEVETHTEDDCTILDSQEHSEAECDSVTSYSNFEEFLNVIKKIQPLPSEWQLVIEPNKVNLLKLVCSPGPVVSFAITISYTLTVQTYFYGQEVHYFNTPFVTNDIKDLTLLLDTIELTKEQKVDLNYIATLLEPYGLNLIYEQLKLHASVEEGCRYSYNTIVASTLIFCSSSSTYSMIRQFGLLLPHPVTLDSFYNSRECLTAANEQNSPLNLPYAKNLFETLDDKDRTVILHLDQLALFDKKRSMFVFSIASPLTRLREVVHIATPKNAILEPKNLYFLISSIIYNLENVGYKVFCIVTGCSRMIMQAMTKFSADEKCDITYPHPMDSQRQLFHIFDPVLLLKTFLLSWIDLPGIDYPDLDSHNKRYATVQSLKTMQDFQDKKLLDLRLKKNIVSTIKNFLIRPSMVGFCEIYNHEISRELMRLSTTNSNFRQTAEFINLFAKLWEMLKVKDAPEINPCSPDHFGYPLMADTDFVTNKKIQFLRAMSLWFSSFKDWEFSDPTMKKVVGLLGHTTQGILDLSKFCIDTLKVDYVLLGSFHSALDELFGKYHIHLP